MPQTLNVSINIFKRQSKSENELSLSVLTCIRKIVFLAVYMNWSSHNGSVHSRNLKTGSHRAPTWQKSRDVTKNVGPQFIIHLIGLVSPLLAMLSVVRHCESLAPVKSLLNFEQEKSLSHEDWNNLFVSTFTKSPTPTSPAICLFPRHRPQPDLWSE